MKKRILLAFLLVCGFGLWTWSTFFTTLDHVLCDQTNNCPAGVAALAGDPAAQHVVIYLQGGPVAEVETDAFAALKGLDPTQFLVLVPYQAQSQPTADYASAPISFDQAKTDAQRSADIAATLVQNYVDDGRDVTVIGISYGAFVGQQLLADQGPIANDYVIGVGRITMPDTVWQAFAEGDAVGFVDGVTPIEVSVEDAGMGGENPTADANMMRLAAGLGYHRYAESLATTDLSNVTYFYGDTDEQVGALSQDEITFLQGQNADVRKVSGGHSDGAEAALLALASRLN